MIVPDSISHKAAFFYVELRLLNIFEDDQKYMLQLLDSIIKMGKKVFVIEAPYPFRHLPILSTVRKEVISYIDKQYRDFVKSKLEQRGIPIIRVPPEFMTVKGSCSKNTNTLKKMIIIMLIMNMVHS